MSALEPPGGSNAPPDRRAMDIAGELAEAAAGERARRLRAIDQEDRELAGRVRTLLDGLSDAARTMGAADTMEAPGESWPGHRPSGPGHALPASRSDPEADGSAGGQVPATDVALPDRVGRYRILRLLGEGGMGAVYEAEQDRPRRPVALKVIRPMLVSRALMRRFELEAEALGRLDHPNIARVYEAGTADGPYGVQPFFAMELIRGRPLTEHADAAGLDARGRAALLAELCDAVQHAHQKGVIHRDLKPANVLADESGRIKVLDFGIARVTDADVHATAQTDSGQIIGTLAYMSPEQAGGDAREVDTRSDVYALGVIGYELLAGRPPLELKGKSLPEAVRLIREQDPPPLSAHDRRLKGDLETIVATAMSKDRDRRYPSAAELAADLRRYLTDEPIAARRPGAWYQARKFARRNKVLVGGVAASFLILLLGIGATTWQAVRATSAERVALSERDAAGQTVEFLTGMLMSVTPAEARGREMTVRELVDEAAATLDDRVSDPRVRAALHNTIAEVYWSLASGGGSGGLGGSEQALAHAEKAYALRRETLGEAHRDTLESANGRASILEALGRYEEAEKIFRDIWQSAAAALGPDDPDTLLYEHNLGHLLLFTGRTDEAEPLLVDALKRQRRLIDNGVKAGNEAVLEDIYVTMHNLAALYSREGRLDEAERQFREMIDLSQRTNGPDHPGTLSSMEGLAGVLDRMKRPAEAEALRRQVIAERGRVLGQDHAATLISVERLAMLLENQQRWSEAEPLRRDLLERRRRALGEDHPGTLGSMGALAGVLLELGRVEEAEALCRDRLQRALAASGEDGEPTLDARYRLAEFLESRGRHEEARQQYEAELAGCRRRFGDKGEQTVMSAKNLIRFYDAAGFPREAARLRRELGLDAGDDSPRPPAPNSSARTSKPAASSSTRRRCRGSTWRWRDWEDCPLRLADSAPLPEGEALSEPNSPYLRPKRSQNSSVSMLLASISSRSAIMRRASA